MTLAEMQRFVDLMFRRGETHPTIRVLLELILQRNIPEREWKEILS